MGKKFIWMGLAGMLIGIVQADQIFFENFDKYDYYTQLSSIEGWSVPMGTPIIKDGQLNFSNSKSAFLLNETYSLSAGTSATHQIEELWIRFRAEFSGDADGAVFRLGVGNSDVADMNSYGRYASVHVKAFAGESSLAEFKAISQNGASANVAPAIEEFADTYCKLTNDSFGNLTISVWYNPQNPAALGFPTCEKSMAYDPAYGGKIFDSIQINAWSSSQAHLIDDIEVGTELMDVTPAAGR